jgi:putative restriction endonuclease
MVVGFINYRAIGEYVDRHDQFLISHRILEASLAGEELSQPLNRVFRDDMPGFEFSGIDYRIAMFVPFDRYRPTTKCVNVDTVGRLHGDLLWFDFSFVSGTVLEQNAGMAKAPSVAWTREHELIALNLYCKLPFGKLHRHNPVIIEVAHEMGRTPNSLAMKLCNFASLDPVQRARGIKGLESASKQDRLMWDEFQSNTAELGLKSEQLLHDLFTRDNNKEVDFLSRDKVRLERPVSLVRPTGPTERAATIWVRRGQQFFRQTILNAYGIRCCITDIAVPRLLIANHIKPWRDFPNERLNPRNGLCLSSLHDAAFDAGLITVDEKLRIVLSKEIKSYLPQSALKRNFASYEGKRILLPEKLAEPDQSCLDYHRTRVFTG